MANKFNDIDESKIIKKKSNESKEEVKEKVQQVKVQAKVQAKVQTKVTVKPEEKVTKVNVTPKVEAKKVEVKPENIQVKQEEKIVVKQEDKVVAKPVEHKKMVEDKVVVSEPIVKKENKVEPQVAKTAAKAETKNKEINVSEKIEKKSSFPVFNVDPVTKSTTPVSNFNYNSQKKKTMNLNVPTDQLKRIKYDTEKCINEITLDIIILNNLINKNDEYCDYYKNKLANLKNELNFYKQKKLTIQALLK
ncbi:MAG: hypothetical protein SOZ53_00045 [Candidatus Onthovivens sp.]|nr:hypothetical protein [Candidatus Onthovivens sp.]